MLNDLEKEAVMEMVTHLRASMEKTLGGVHRELVIEFAVELVNRELVAGEASDDVRGGAVVFFSHRIMRHGKDVGECNRCRKNFPD